MIEHSKASNVSNRLQFANVPVLINTSTKRSETESSPVQTPCWGAA